MRRFKIISCGCLVSSDNGGALILCSHHSKHKEKKGDPLYNWLKESKQEIENAKEKSE